jgi:uncharacterized repeat protein (TIGR03803 family)
METTMLKSIQNWTANLGSAPLVPLFALMLLFTLISPVPTAQGQTLTVLHTFTGGTDGFQPYSGVTLDQAGNLYGTTTEYYDGTVFQIKHRNGGWIFSTLVQFGNGEWMPQGRLVFGPGGVLYGTTYRGGNGFCTEFGCGVVYSPRPPQTICRSVSCPWTNDMTYSFTGPDGFAAGYVALAFDSAGNIYGTTTQGGNYSGNVFQLTRSNGGWTATSLHDFDGSDGYEPYSGVVLSAQGDLYGTTWMQGPNNRGSVYRLTNSGSGWTLDTLYAFPNNSDGANPVGGLVFDQAGNLYGTTQIGGSGGGGTVFELSPSGGGWNFTVLHSFSGQNGPSDTLAMDAAGNLYGTTYADGAYAYGSVFKLTRNNGSWSYTDLHDFTSGADGANPVGGVSLDASGNLYGTTSDGAGGPCTLGCGTVWEITP